MNFNHVVCICTGNICRSPLAEGLLRRDIPGITASSAGVGAVVGGRMPEAAADIAEREGLSLADHRGRQVTSEILRDNDLILVMEEGQKAWLTSRFPECRGKVFMISQWGDQRDLPDPYRQSGEFFEEVYEKLEQYMKGWQEKLR